MLNISENKVSKSQSLLNYSALDRVEDKVTKKLLLRILKWSFLILFILVFLPWTQNVRSSGVVSTLNPDQRPQTVHSIIAGRVDAWFVREGDLVKKGDTIAVISEIKDDYFDKDLLPRTKNQLDLKKQSATTYGQKEIAQNDQLIALERQKNLKLRQAKVKLGQAKLKIQNDSITYQAAKLNSKTAQIQFERMDSMYRKGLKSLVDLETRKIKKQQTLAYEVEAQNKWVNSQNEWISLQIELLNIQTKFENDYAKVLSEKLTTSTNRFEAESSVNKLKNQYTNYKIRQGYYVIVAPQDGYITKAFINGIGETLKEGQEIVSIMPDKVDLAVEIYIDPIDLPLMNVGEHVRIQFDGWPAIVFSGWPNASYGTYGGEIYAIDRFIGENGKFRLLVKPDEIDHKWPEAIRVGGGTKTMILLDEVPIWYELWRKINGFPPNYYEPIKEGKSKNKK